MWIAAGCLENNSLEQHAFRWLLDSSPVKCLIVSNKWIEEVLEAGFMARYIYRKSKATGYRSRRHNWLTNDLKEGKFDLDSK